MLRTSGYALVDVVMVGSSFNESIIYGCDEVSLYASGLEVTSPIPALRRSQ